MSLPTRRKQMKKMARKPASMYRYVKGMPTKRKEYMGGVPASRITQFVVGNKTDKFSAMISLHALERCNVRHDALEAARITVTRDMEKKL
jgi:large subunit ribosomal protein L10e